MLTIRLVRRGRVGVDGQAGKPFEDPGTAALRHWTPQHGTPEDRSRSVDLEVFGHDGREAVYRPARDVEWHPSEVGIRVVHLGEHRHAVDANPVDVDAQVRRLAPPILEQCRGCRLGIVDAAEAQLGMRPAIRTLDDVGVESNTDGERRVLDRGLAVACRFDPGESCRNGGQHCDRLSRVSGLPRQTEDPGGYVGRAGRDDRESGRGPGNAVGRVVYDAVTAHDRNHVDSVVGGACRSLSRLLWPARPLREDIE